jgi:hypothetical protein
VRSIELKEKPQLQIGCGWGFGFAESDGLKSLAYRNTPAQPRAQQQLQQQTAGM